MLVKINLRAELINNSSPPQYQLILDDGVHSGRSDTFETEVTGREKVKWQLAKNSKIKSLTGIWSDEDTSKVFKNKPTRNFFFRQEFDVEIVEFKEEQRVKYNIGFIAEDGTNVVIDPYIRIKPPHP